MATAATLPRMPVSAAILQDLRKAYASDNLIVFAGAGISTAAGLPTWPQLAQKLRDRLVSEGKPPAEVDEVDGHIKRDQFIDALSCAQQSLGDNEFGLMVEAEVEDRHIASPPDVAMAIAELQPKLKAVLTTNLDRLLERAFMGSWQAITTPTGDLAQRRRYIFKFHGTTMERSTWVFTRSQYDQATFGRPQYRTLLQALFHAFPILFVGFGLVDDDIDQTLGAIRALAGPNPPIHFALLKGPIPPFRRTKLEGAGIRLLEYDDHNEVPGILRSIP